MTAGAVEVHTVAADSWVAETEAAVADGFTFLNWLGGVDEVGRSDHIRVVLSLLRRRDGATLRLETLLDRDAAAIPTISSLLPGASWYEREAAEEFGITVVGGDPRPLLQPDLTTRPLRKDAVLGARVAQAWPGAKEPGEGSDDAPSRRRMVPPGVPDATVWGDRDPGSPLPTPAEVAESAQGGRVRRRTR